jgi:hypothetical protein
MLRGNHFKVSAATAMGFSDDGWKHALVMGPGAGCRAQTRRLGLGENTPHQILQNFPIVPCSNVKFMRSQK